IYTFAFCFCERNERHNNPCFGEKINAIKNIIVAANTITAPDSKLYSELMYKPITAEKAPKNAANTIITENLFVNKYAVDAGVISMATTKTAPTVCNDATVVKGSNTRIPY